MNELMTAIAEFWNANPRFIVSCWSIIIWCVLGLAFNWISVKLRVNGVALVAACFLAVSLFNIWS